MHKAMITIQSRGNLIPTCLYTIVVFLLKLMLILTKKDIECETNLFLIILKHVKERRKKYAAFQKCASFSSTFGTNY